MCGHVTGHACEVMVMGYLTEGKGDRAVGSVRPISRRVRGTVWGPRERACMCATSTLGLYGWTPRPRCRVWHVQGVSQLAAMLLPSVTLPMSLPMPYPTAHAVPHCPCRTLVPRLCRRVSRLKRWPGC